jgi:hypothetical protein
MHSAPSIFLRLCPSMIDPLGTGASSAQRAAQA